MAGEDKPVENEIVVLIDRLPEPSVMTRHLDPRMCLLWVEDVPTLNKLRDAVQIGERRGRLRHLSLMAPN